MGNVLWDKNAQMMELYLTLVFQEKQTNRLNIKTASVDEEKMNGKEEPLSMSPPKECLD